MLLFKFQPRYVNKNPELSSLFIEVKNISKQLISVK